MSITPRPGASRLTQLHDVAVTSPSAGQALNYNGTEWVNVNVASATKVGTVITSNVGTGRVDVSLATGGTLVDVACYSPMLPTIGSSVLCELLSDGSTVVVGVLVSGWVPSSLSSLTLWLDASDAGTITQSGGHVTSWLDKSGNSHNAVAISGVAGPVVHAAAISGRNTLTFGAGGRSGLQLPSLSTQASYTVAGVVAPPFESGHTLILDSTNSTNVQVSPNGDLIAYAGSVLASHGNPVSVPMEFICQFGPSSAIRVNGVQVASGSTGDGRVIASPVLGAGQSGSAAYHLAGDIAELIVWDRALTTAELTLAENYLKSKWSIA